MASQRDLALQMVQQLRILDPSISAEVGTPERKIIDTVAQSLADNQIDLALLASAFDLDSKVGSDLDKFLSIFGFGRQQGSTATGYVKFSRPTVSAYDISIPRGTQVRANISSANSAFDIATVTFYVSEPVTLPAGNLSVIAPITALNVGVAGNVAAGTITEFSSSPILGITELTNEIPTSGGLDAESDNEYKVRFKNTVFRNLSGTDDQFLALAIQTQFTTKANVVGPISRYREYVQIPAVDDADSDDGYTGNGPTGEYTTALSTVPYSKHIYDTVPYFVSIDEGAQGNPIFYREDLDYVLNTSFASKNKGDAYRIHRENIAADPTNTADDPLSSTNLFRPSLTFTSVYTGADPDIEAARPVDVVLFEHSYMSLSSRNDWTRQILNCVDVFINGQNPTKVDAVIPRPSGTVNVFNASPGHRFSIDSYRRVGEAHRSPVLGNVFSPLYWSPITDLPDFIATSDATYFKDVHYFAVVDVSDIGGTVRARTGIEWAMGVNGSSTTNADDGTFSGPKIVATVDTAIEVLGYFYDRNVNDLQVSMESNKQTTSDVLAHQATNRYFKLDVTVMYERGLSTGDVNSAINEAVQEFLTGLYFGSVLQLSDLLQVVHNVPGVDNVRWSKDVLITQGLSVDTNGDTRDRLVECDVNGSPLLDVLVDRRVQGDAFAIESQQLYKTGSPTGGTFVLSYASVPTVALAYNISATLLQSTLRTLIGDSLLTVTGTGTRLSPWIVSFSATGVRELIEVIDNDLVGGSTIFNADFFLSDDELPSLPTGQVIGDTVPGLIIRTRAQNTWNQL